MSRRVRDDDGISLDDACKLYYNLIYTKCVRELFGNTSLADDVTQNVFYELIRKWDSLRKKNIYGWLSVTASHMISRAKAEYKKTARTLALEDYMSYERTRVYSDDMVERITGEAMLRDFEKYYDKVSDKLGEREKTLAECLRGKMKYADIAVKLGMTENAVKMAVSRLRVKVRDIVRSLI